MNRLLFSKTGDAVYISHLDLMRIFQRAFKRADIMIWHSQGFSPRAYVSIVLPLSVGASSECEVLDFEVEDGTVDLQSLPEKLNATMPEGVRVLKAYNSECKMKHLSFLRAAVTLEYDAGVPADAKEKLAELFSKDAVIVHKKTKRGETDLDLKPLIREMKMRQTSDTELALEVVVTAKDPVLNPQLLVTAIETHLPQYAPDFSRVHRLDIYDENMNPFR